MNRPTKLMLICAAATLAIPTVHPSSVSLQEPADPPAGQVSSLRVENGKPSGTYEVGTQIVVSADDPLPGSEFIRWTGDIAILANPFLARTTATIPSTPVTITATYTEPTATEVSSGETPAEVAPRPAPTANSPSHSDQGWGG